MLYRRFSLGDADNQGTANALPNEPSGGENGRRPEGIERPSDPRTTTVGDVTFRVVLETGAREVFAGCFMSAFDPKRTSSCFTC